MLEGRPNRRTKKQVLPDRFKTGFLSTLDGRTDIAKALRANYVEIVDDLGGASDIGHIKRTLIERFCWLRALLESLEHELATGSIDREAALTRWISAVSTLVRLAAVLGLEKKLVNAPWLPVAEPKK